MEQTSQEIWVAARPAPLVIDPQDTAVIVVDMQYGFFGQGGTWDRIGVEVSGAQSIIAPIARVLATARGAGLPIVYLTMDFEGARRNDLCWLVCSSAPAPSPHSGLSAKKRRGRG